MPTWKRGWRCHPADSCGLLASFFSFTMSEWSGCAPTKNMPQASLSLRIKQGPILCVDCLSFSSHSFSSFCSAKFPYVVQWHHLRPLYFFMLGSPGTRTFALLGTGCIWQFKSLPQYFLFWDVWGHPASCLLTQNYYKSPDFSVPYRPIALWNSYLLCNLTNFPQ